MAALVARPLDETTWPDFAALVEKHGGVWGGCWCMAFHAGGAEKGHTFAEKKAMKETRVRAGTTHAAVVYDGETAVGWCQFGPTPELPRIKHRREYLDAAAPLPDWRITCFFTDRGYRGKGVAAAGLKGALAEIARLGGGVVESYPHNGDGKKVSAAFIHNATLPLFEREGFTPTRRLGKNTWVVSKAVAAA